MALQRDLKHTLNGGYMDVLSEILALSHVTGSVLAEIDCCGEWAIDMLDNYTSQRDHQHMIPFHYMLEGQAYLVEGTVHTPLKAGDLIVAAKWPPHIIASHPVRTATGITEIISANGLAIWDGASISSPLSIVTGTGASTARILSGTFKIEGHAIDLLLSHVPDLLVLSVSDDPLDDQFGTTLAFVRQKGQGERPGYVAVAERLNDLLFIQILRSCMATAQIQSGLLAALTDKNIARALSAIHADPAAKWTVSSLAARSYLSRTIFAERFRRLVGATPLQYVNHWRMIIAENLLLRSKLPVSEVQARLGFASSFAFARAFRNAYGMNPSEYRKAAKNAESADVLELHVFERPVLERYVPKSG